MAPKAGKNSGQLVEGSGLRLRADAAEIFVDPMMGAPLPMFVEREVEDADKVIELITKHGGLVSSGYSNVNYIIVNSNTDAGRNLARQYAGKKGKVVLASDWVYQCIRAGELVTFKANWAGCKMDGYEGPAATFEPPPPPSPPPIEAPTPAPRGKKRPRPSEGPSVAAAMPTHPPPGTLVHQPAAPSGYPLTTLTSLANGGQLASWNSLASAQLPPHPPHPGHHPHAQHMGPPHIPRMFPAGPGMGPPPTQPPQPALRGWDPTFSASHNYFGYPPQDAWPDEANPYYPHPFPPSAAFHAPPPEDPYSQAPFETPSNDEAEEEEPPAATSTEAYERGRPTNRASRSATARQSIAQAGTPRTFPPRRPLARSPTPPSRIMKSTFGGNLFTSEDILYLKKYIDYCQQQGLILSLREICERLAIKAPHHTFYSWRRFCNKHQIKLGAYDMAVFHRNAEEANEAQAADNEGEDDAANGEEVDEEEEDEEVQHPIIEGPPPVMPTPARGRAINAPPAAGYMGQSRERSPTPPKTLYRSTTGKGVAFTEEDVTYLLRYLQFAQGQDMVQVWRDIAQKAPHHSRASWMKYWRRHKHEYEGDRLPPPPQAGPDEPAMKRKRYDRADDIMLARLMLSKPAGTSDGIFQEFSRLPEHSHHPWKGWQEHHRIHKAKIDHIMVEIEQGTFKE